MKRPLQLWVLFGGCAVVVLVAMGWLTVLLLGMETAAFQRAGFEENLRLALWRMDSAIGPVIAREHARPISAFQPLHQTASFYDSDYNIVSGLQVSSILTDPSPFAKLYFQYHPDGRATSPQAPQGPPRQLVAARYSDEATLLACEVKLDELQSLAPRAQLSTQLAALGPEPNLPAQSLPEPTMAAGQQAEDTNETLLNMYDVSEQRKRAGKELAQRDRVYSSNQGQYGKPQLAEDSQAGEPQAPNAEAVSNRSIWKQELQQQVSRSQEETELDTVSADSTATMRPIWIGHELLLVRRVQMRGSSEAFYLQGCWMDWPRIQGWLLEQVVDLLPDAKLLPLQPGDDVSAAHRLATLPLRLDPGPMPTAPITAGWTPLRITLGVAWLGVFIAVAAGAVLLQGVIGLSERRGAFVSAVTHELRTPLTTFRMYTEMLRDGMVPDEADRQTYLRTLAGEADRLQHLIENVLAYSRLERGSARARCETLTVRDLVARVLPSLQQRVEQAQGTLDVRLPDDVAAASVHTDAGAVEQVLFNLVDNACKYALPHDPKRALQLDVHRDAGHVLLALRDHGPGIARADQRRLFEPFCKSANEAAATAPGVGLGLALSRKLARSLRGDLRFDATTQHGTCFSLQLPAMP